MVLCTACVGVRKNFHTINLTIYILHNCDDLRIKKAIEAPLIIIINGLGELEFPKFTYNFKSC